MSPLDKALWLAQFVPVFPCGPNKRPTCYITGQKGKGGFKMARRWGPDVKALWSLYPGTLIGMPTGEASGISVLDIDAGGEIWLEANRWRLGRTRVQWTRSGGQHWLYRHRKGIRDSVKKIAPGIDTRGAGGYVIAWQCEGLPCENPEVLADWPEWLFGAYTAAVGKSKPPPPAPVSQLDADVRADLMLARAVDRIRRAVPGKRHETLRAACRTIGGLARYISTSENEVQTYLVDLIMSTGAEDRDNAERTATWALEHGRAAPLLVVRDPFGVHPL